ncbi:hypothetical protein D3C75_990410 [compost metagenome]
MRPKSKPKMLWTMWSESRPSLSRHIRKVGGTGSDLYPAALATASSVYTGSVSPMALAKKRRRPFSTSAVVTPSERPIRLLSAMALGSCQVIWKTRARNERAHYGSAATEQGHDARATQTEVVLQSMMQAFDLTGFGGAA